MVASIRYFAVRTICSLYHRRPQRLAEGLRRAVSGPIGVASGRTGVRAEAAIPWRAGDRLHRPLPPVLYCALAHGRPAEVEMGRGRTPTAAVGRFTPSSPMGSSAFRRGSTLALVRPVPTQHQDEPDRRGRPPVRFLVRTRTLVLNIAKTLRGARSHKRRIVAITNSNDTGTTGVIALRRRYGREHQR
jgi:hypothetical protein